MMKKRINLLVCVLLAASLLGGCADGTKTSENKEETKHELTETAAVNGKAITYAIKNEPETLDPGVNNYANASNVLQNLFTGLYMIGADGELVPSCAESYEMSEDGLIYTFKLKAGLKWSDGSALTASDFEYAWKRVLNPDTASPASWNLYYLKNGEAYNTGKATADDVGVKAVDDTTLLVTLENPTAYFLSLIAVSEYFPVKKEAVEGAEVWTKAAKTYVCNGAFMMKEINPQANYVLEKNPNYVYASDMQLDCLNIVFIESPEAALAAFNSGEVDVLDRSLVGTQAISQYMGKDQLKSYDLIGTTYYDLNCSKEYMSKAEVRKALALSIDRDVINQSVVPSKPVSAYGFVPFGISYAGKTEDYRTTVGDLFKEDVEEAKNLLAQAGYPNGEGFPTLIFITPNDQEKKDIAQAMQAMWKESLGINVEIVTYESKVYWNEHSAGNFDIAFDGWTGEYPDPYTNLNCFVKTRTYDESRWSGPKADQYDEMIKESRILVDNGKRMEIFAEAEKILMEDMPIIPLFFKNSIILVNPRCKDINVSYIGHNLFKFANVE